MKIKRLEICGFKSFVDKTVVTFDREVTGIVGPNGCGKSNIVDAIRWSMGEQSAKHLRGKHMDDVIFNGSESRGPHSFAEVTLTFENDDGLGPAEYRDYAEISVTRRLDRQGNSDYLINKTPVRLMDITNLFLGTGVGTKAYSIIEQGRIGLIVSAKPEERRHLIEEAAGITKFKAKKKAAERKMDQTRQNLLRLKDLASEIERTVASLKRQAQKAERYKAYRAEIRDLELFVASHRWMELTVTLKALRADLDRALATVDGVRSALRVRDAEVEALRLGVYDLERVVDQAQARAYELDNAVRLIESQVQNDLVRLEELRQREGAGERELVEMATHRQSLVDEKLAFEASLAELEAIEKDENATFEAENAELESRRSLAEAADTILATAGARTADAAARIARAETVLETFERRRTEARTRLERMKTEDGTLGQGLEERAQEIEDLKARLHGLESGKNRTVERRAEVEAKLESLRVEIRESDKILERMRAETAQRRSRLHSLEEIQHRFEGVGAGVRALMTKFAGDERARTERGVLGLVADRLECPPELTQALAGALGEKLQYVVVRDLEAGKSAVEFLAQGEQGRATTIPQRPRRSVAPENELPAGVDASYLVDSLVFEGEDEALVRHLLGDVIVVGTLEDALRLSEAGIAAERFVTRTGEVLARDGRLTGGSGESVGAHMLDVKREVRQLHETVASLETGLTAAVARHGELRRGIVECQAELEGAKVEGHEAEIAIVKTEKDVRRVEEEMVRMGSRRTQLETEISELSAALDDANEEELAARSEIESARAARSEAESAQVEASQKQQAARESVDVQAAVVTELKVRVAQARQKVEGDRQALERLERSVGELEAREARVREDLAQGARTQGELAARVIVARDELSLKAEGAMDAHEKLGEARVRYDAAKEEMGSHEAALRTLRSRIDEANEEASGLQLRERELAIELEHLLDQVAERHRVDLPKVLGDYHMRDLPDESVRVRIDELLRLVERMGEINLTAIEEFAEQSKRFEEYDAQIKDLDSALEQLDSAIRKMNRESRRMFRETFEAVSALFQHTFPRMFGGGKAELRLTNPDDVLESGVEIIAMPPGKRLGSIELMSGGEKALTAVSLIFAIFQYKPSPFCLLDEVDAPLDEANIDRFASAVREMTGRSQFIVITHSKRTMETADVLFGVTMETPGISKLVSVELRQHEARNKAVTPQEVAVA